MSLFFRRADDESRAISYQDVWGSGGDWQAGRAAAGELVNETTAMGLDAVWSCVDLLSRIVASLPVDALSGSGPAARSVSPQPSIVAAPSLKVTRRDWIYQGMSSLLLHGNACGYVLGRDRMFRPTAVEWLDPTTVTIEEPSALALPTFRVGGERVPNESIWHLRAFVRPGSAIGVAPLDRHRDTFGLGLAARRYGSHFFASDAHPTGLLYTDNAVDETQATILKARFKQAVRKRDAFVAGAGVKYQQVQTAPNESQFLETQDRIATSVARVFGVPPEMIGAAAGGKGSLTYANRVDRAQDLLTFTVNHWLAKFEDALTEALPRPQYVRFNTGGLLKSDLKTRYESYQIGLGAKFLTVNEVRSLEDRPPLPGGDVPPADTGGTE